MICSKSLLSMVPQRVILSIMGFFGVTVSFVMRACLSVAITDMIIPMNKTNNVNNFSVCPADIPSSASSTTNRQFDYENVERFDWNEQQQSFVLSSFYVGYLISHIPGGIMAEKFGGKWMMSMSILLTAICNALIPQALSYGGYNAVISLRILMGLFEGILFPSLSVLLSAWVPERERGKLGSLTLSGPQVGNLLAFYLSGIILVYQPWPLVFYFWSFIAMIWFLFFVLLCYRDPASHPFITEKELIYLKVEMGQLQRHTNLPSTPWKSIFTSVPVIVLVISQMGNDCLWVTLAIDLPKYMKEVLGFSIDKAGLFSSIPYLFMWIVSISSGFLCDYLIERCYLTTVQARRLFTALSGIVPAILVVASSYAACNRLLAVILLTTAVGFMGNYYPGMRVNAFDLSPNYAGSIISVVNGSGAITGLTFPVFIGYMIPDSTLEQWSTVFWTILGVAFVRIYIFSTWSSGDIQSWNNPKNSKSSECGNSTSHAEIHKAKTLHEYFSDRN